MTTIYPKRFGHLHLMASASFPAVWCVDNSQLLRQESSDTASRGQNVLGLSSRHRSHNFGLATLEAAGETTLTWDHKRYPIARAAATTATGVYGHGDHHRQHAASSSASTHLNLKAMSMNHNRGSNVPPAELVQLEDGERLCTLADFVGEQGTRDGPGNAGPGPHGNPAYSWSTPLNHTEGNYSTAFADDGCSNTGEGDDAYWFVKFADGEQHHVSKIRLWNRNAWTERLNGACVRFTEDGNKPSHTLDSLNQTANCDAVLPNSVLDGAGGGTEVLIDRSIVGIMLISVINDGYLTICGAQIYEQLTTTSTSTTTLQQATTQTNATTTADEGETSEEVSSTTADEGETSEEASSVGLVIGVVLALAVVGGVGAALATGAIGGGGGSGEAAAVRGRQGEGEPDGGGIATIFLT
mmetsp:Transcript_17827/g.44587  ORF Transcript_17827/g.44587 Transcript_17827/m.44587 type:complete len:412 (+) Transcript_17827:250-1485(+)